MLCLVALSLCLPMCFVWSLLLRYGSCCRRDGYVRHRSSLLPPDLQLRMCVRCLFLRNLQVGMSLRRLLIASGITRSARSTGRDVPAIATDDVGHRSFGLIYCSCALYDRSAGVTDSSRCLQDGSIYVSPSSLVIRPWSFVYRP